MDELAINIKSVNFHLWEPCNMRCKFCFATFQDVKSSILPKGHLDRESTIQIIDKLADAGFNKITFAGGEPTLCKWLPDLIERAKECGLTTMLVTNGSILTESYLRKLNNALDWIVLSIDSLNTQTNIETGRTLNREPFSKEKYLNLIGGIKQNDIRFKMNTVVTSKNYNEDLTHFLKIAIPERWKVLQVLHINGQNNGHFEEFKISDSQFHQFVLRHKKVEEFGIEVVDENNDLMTGSYIMIDPAGRFFDNLKGQHTYSEPILKVGIHKALSQITRDYKKFLDRGGIYDWK